MTTLDLSSVGELTRAAEEDPAWFWGAVARWLDLDWQKPPSSVSADIKAGHLTRWFPDGALNIADNAVDRWVRRGRHAETALLWELEDGSRGSWTFADLAAEIDTLCHGLVALGVEPGDRVGVQLPMVREAAVAALACAKMGAVCVPIFSGYGGSAVADRLDFAAAKVHIVADSFPRRGRAVDVRGGLADCLATVTSLEHTITVRVGEQPSPGKSLPGELSWHQVLEQHRGKTFEAFRCPTDHPLMIAFTSGSTGKPKGIVLGHAGFAVKAGSDAAFSFDLGRSDTAAWITDPGWIMSPIVLFGGMIAGSAVAMYAGTPDWPDTRRVWDFSRAAGVSMLGLSPTLVRLLMSKPGSKPDDRGRLRVLASSGEPWTPDAYRWLHEEAFAEELPIINYSGGTEVSGAILSNTTIQPIHPCGFAGPMPGMGADIVDDEGASLRGGVGELVLRNPSPGMPLAFWRDPGRYRETYWDRWPGVWHHGDFAERAEGAWFIHGRSDDTLKIAGKRVGPSEIESVVNAVDGIVESAAVGIPHPVKGDGLVVFARFQAVVDEEATRRLITDQIGAKLGKALRPLDVYLVVALPKTRSGKILRRMVRAAYLGQPYGDVSMLDDPSALTAIEETR